MGTQFKMRVDEAFVQALELAARNHGRRSAQEVAEDVIRTYLPFWEQAEQLKKNKVTEQREALFGDEGMIWAEKGKPIKQPRRRNRALKSTP